MTHEPWAQVFGFLSFFLPWAGKGAKRWMQPWALVSLLALARALSTESRLEAGTAFVLAFASFLVRAEPGFRFQNPLFLSLLLLGIPCFWRPLPWLPVLVLLLPLYWVLAGEGEADESQAWPGLSILAWVFWREGPEAASLLPGLLAISALSFRRAKHRVLLPTLLWALACLSAFPERAWVLLPLFGALPWLLPQAEGKAGTGRLLVALALALPLAGVLPSGNAGLWALWLLAAMSLLSIKETGFRWSGAFVFPCLLPPAALALGGPAWPSWEQLRLEEGGPLPSDPPGLPAGMVLLPVLVLIATWLLSKALSLRKNLGFKAGHWESFGSLAAGAACLFLCGRLAGSVGGLYQGREGGGPLVLSLDSLALLLAGLAYLTQACEDEKPALAKGLALALLFLAPDLPSALIAALVLIGPKAPSRQAGMTWSGWPVFLLGGGILAKAWGGWSLPDLAASGASASYSPLAALGFSLLAGGAALSAGLLRGRAEDGALPLILLWLVRLAARLPQESAPVLTILGLLVLLQGLREEGPRRLRRCLFAAGLISVSLALRRASPGWSLAGLILISLSALESGMAMAPGSLAWFPALAGGLALFFPQAALELLRPAAEFLSGS